jgi:hypothetical protein
MLPAPAALCRKVKSPFFPLEQYLEISVGDTEEVRYFMMLTNCTLPREEIKIHHCLLRLSTTYRGTSRTRVGGPDYTTSLLLLSYFVPKIGTCPLS